MLTVPRCGGAGSEFGPAEQAGGFRVGGGGGDLAGRAGLAELAADDDGEVVADAQCFVAVVGDVHGGDVESGQEFGEQRAQVFAGGLVERGQGLIEQQQAGLDGQRPGEGDPLAFAAGQRSRGPGGQGRDSQAVEQRIGAGARGLAAGLRPEPDVPGDGQVREQGGVLEDQADAALFGGQGGDVGSGQADAAGAVRAEPGDGFQEHGLAGPGRAEDGQDLAGCDGQADRAEAEGSGLAGQVADDKAAVSRRHG